MDEKVSQKVVTKSVETRGGVQTTTTTITCCKEDFDTAFQKLQMDPEKFGSGGTSVTRQIIYTNSDGHREVMEETVETYGDTKPTIKDNIVEPEILSKDKETGSKPKKSFTEKLGLSFGKSGKTGKDANEVKPTEKSSGVKAGQFEEECLQKHNDYRRKHVVEDLALSKEICIYAKEWADHLALTDSFKHRTERKYGENIFMKWSSDPNHTVTGEEAVDSWYSEIKDHNFGQEPKSLKSGHFTQVIWKGSKNLGVAWSKSKTGKIIVVANYDPAGNFVGHFRENVPPPKN